MERSRIEQCLLLDAFWSNKLKRAHISRELPQQSAIDEMPLAQWRHTLGVDLDGVFLGCKHGVRAMKKVTAKGGPDCAIVNISSALGLVGASHCADYVAAKGGVRLLTKAVALGDLSKQIEVDARGEILDLKNTVNGMVVRLRALAAEVTRVTLEVGSQGKLGGQAHVPDVEGVWYELVRNVSGSYRPLFLFLLTESHRKVNRMCASLTDQVRSIAKVMGTMESRKTALLCMSPRGARGPKSSRN